MSTDFASMASQFLIETMKLLGCDNKITWQTDAIEASTAKLDLKEHKIQRQGRAPVFPRLSKILGRDTARDKETPEGGKEEHHRYFPDIDQGSPAMKLSRRPFRSYSRRVLGDTKKYISKKGF